MKRPIFKTLIVILVVACVVAFKTLNLGQYLTLEALKMQQDALNTYYEGNSAAMIGAYFAVYALTAALSFPGATVLTLAGGAVFGFWLGTLIVSFASTIGATLAFAVSRFLLRDWMQSKFREKLTAINEGIKKEGAFYLFALRLVPAFPFFLVNLVMGLTPIKTTTFYWVSQLGMLAGTMAYVYAGTQLSQIQSVSGILSPGLLLAFVIVGVLPLVSKSAIAHFRASKWLRRYRRPKRFDYNVVVIGGGSAGLVSAYIAAAVKAKVALIEKHRMGGDCLNTGCVPSKALIRSAKILSYIRRAQEFGLDPAEARFDFARVMERVQRVIGKVEPHDSIERYTKLGVDCIQGTAKIVSPYEIEVNGKLLTTRNIIVATGARPLVPPIAGLEKIKALTSDTVWEIRQLPKRLLVLGGGPIGCELAQAFARFGSEVSLVEMVPRILIREDADVSAFVTEKFKNEGVRVLASHKAKSFETDGSRKWLVCETDGREVRVDFDEVLLALGRKANVTGFGLEELGVEISKPGTIEHDEFMRTNYPNIYVCGDVAGPYQFTHMAAHQAWYASVNALFSPLKKFKADYRVVPWATFTDPEVARVGLNETEAGEKGIEHRVTKYGIEDLDRAIAEEEDHGFVKVLTRPGGDKVLGATIVGSHAGDIIAEYVAAMKHGFGLNKILGTIHIYPTLAEANKYAAGNWKKATVPKRALEFLEKFHEWRRA
ncbi:MAG: FAD-dependent oxidoreductase [Deltaproteobacteria bacterium]|nr:FAD-dependent oxidoreductase [Deltaproteobacteria bacterium]